MQVSVVVLENFIHNFLWWIRRDTMSLQTKTENDDDSVDRKRILNEKRVRRDFI